MNGELEYRNVKFTATKIKHEHCICSCCHGVGTVTILVIPKTLYKNGKDLFIKYEDWWICEACQAKLLSAIRESV